MPDELTVHDVYVNAVRDHLNDTPNASHPVQFVAHGGLDICTLCGATVVADDAWRDCHRRNHDRHNRVHQSFADELNRHHHSEKRYR